MMTVGFVVALFLIGTYHNPLMVFFSPFKITFPLYDMMHSFFAKCTLHPALHNLVTDKSAWFFIPGRIYPSRAASGT
jgi:hypothetical protein